jgi:hypothetical protein
MHEETSAFGVAPQHRIVQRRVADLQMTRAQWSVTGADEDIVKGVIA